MDKSSRYFSKVAAYKEKFRRLSTEMIRYRLNHFETALYPEARVALRQLLEERDREEQTSEEMESG
jgi:hypothetical protein